ncbi:MAG: Gfo/Idh/MocA family oxidoreductase [Acidobacteria bacterium]|nr:Gfo/Idh/MocA family oxidoreductase [Acidobacteriota bacterium]MCA1642863.1 Gfo/Idh/MocA family oxidoreductase [Acidobacteriota bacterium]
MLSTAVIGTGSLGRHHARVHAALAAEGRALFVAACDTNEEIARAVAAECGVECVTDWRALLDRVDAVSLAVPTESHALLAVPLLEAGIHVLVEKPISRTLAEADEMIAAARRGGATLMVGHLERFNPALTALRPHVKNPVYFEIHRVGEFTARSLDIDVVLDLMIHDLDIVQWLVGSDVEATDVRAVGIPVLTSLVDAANARVEFASGAVANITASRVGMEKIRKMRFFQPHDYVAVDYVTRYASISSLAPAGAAGHPGVAHRRLEVEDVEPLRAEIESFLAAAESRAEPPVTGEDGRRALALALRALESIHDHDARAGINALGSRTAAADESGANAARSAPTES